MARDLLPDYKVNDMRVLSRRFKARIDLSSGFQECHPLHTKILKSELST